MAEYLRGYGTDVHRLCFHPGISQSAGWQQGNCRAGAFTSQGCKSCPPADKNFAKYADDPNVLALRSTSIIGITWAGAIRWPPRTIPTGSNSYRNAFHAKMIYTPQAIINGAVEANGRNGAAINAKIAANKLDSR